MADMTIDWGRAVTIGAVSGGGLWALAAFAIMHTDGSPFVIVAICVAALTIAASGLAVYRLSYRSNIRTYATAAILAPLTGAITVITFFLGALALEIVN